MKKYAVTMSILLSVFPLFTLLSFFYLDLRSNTKKQIIQSFQREVNAGNKTFENFLIERQANLRDWSQSTFVKVALEFQRPESLNHRLDFLLSQYPSYSSLSLQKEDGTPFASSNAYSSKSLPLRLSQSYNHVSEAIWYNPKDLKLIFSHPVFNRTEKGEIEKYLFLGEVKREVLLDFLAQVRQHLRPLNISEYTVSLYSTNIGQNSTSDQLNICGQSSDESSIRICALIASKSVLTMPLSKLSIFLLFSTVVLIGLTFLIFARSFEIFVSPLHWVFDSLNHVIRGESATISFNSRIPELKEMETKFNLVVKQLAESRETIKSHARMQAQIDLAAQVAHDIRSPLSALNLLMTDAMDIPEEKRILMRNSIQRINDIANDLFGKGKHHSEPTSTRKGSEEPILLSAEVESVLSEKRMQYRTHMGLELINNSPTLYGIFVDANTAEFKRVFSNLISNAVESFDGKPGRVNFAAHITEDANAKFIGLSIADNGKGIAPEVLSQLGKRGASFGKEQSKESGSGLGLYHARKCIESVGGSIRIDSKLNVGTTVTIELRLKEAPPWFGQAITIGPVTQIIILDDDLAIHSLWLDRLRPILLDQALHSINHFSSANDFKTWIDEKLTKGEDFKNYVFLMDFELLNQSTTGLDLIEQYSLASQSYLVTSRYDETNIRGRCLKQKVPLIPKGLAGFVPIKTAQASVKKLKPDVLLLDDEDLQIKLWTFSAKQKNKSLVAFQKPDLFFSELPKYDLETEIFIDSNLGNGIKGEDLLVQLHESGYKNLHISSGYPSSQFAHLIFLKGIHGKEPLFPI